MDGLLIDSEPVWRRSLVKVYNGMGIPLTIDMCKQTMGMRIDEVVEYWAGRYALPVTKEKMVSDILQEVISLIRAEGKAMPGVEEIISLFASQKIPMAIASSSTMAVIDAVLERVSIKDKMKVIHSAEHEPYGKPHPGVFITTAEKLGVPTGECLVFEDSANGVLAAKAAKMKCVAVPDSTVFNDKRFGIADLTLASLKEFTLEHFRSLEN